MSALPITPGFVAKFSRFNYLNKSDRKNGLFLCVNDLLILCVFVCVYWNINIVQYNNNDNY